MNLQNTKSTAYALGYSYNQEYLITDFIQKLAESVALA